MCPLHYIQKHTYIHTYIFTFSKRTWVDMRSTQVKINNLNVNARMQTEINLNKCQHFLKGKLTNWGQLFKGD